MAPVQPLNDICRQACRWQAMLRCRWESMLSDNMRLLRDQYGFDTVALHRKMLDLAKVPAGQLALDVGSGSGWMAAVLAEGGLDVVALDVDWGMLMRTGQRWRQMPQGVVGRFDVVQADALHLPFASGAFDAVFSFDVLHHVPDCPRAVAEMLRVRKPAGVFAVADLNPRGLRAVEEVMSRGGELHFDNGCRVETIPDVLTQMRVRFERHDLGFVTAYIARPHVAIPG